MSNVNRFQFDSPFSAIDIEDYFICSFCYYIIVEPKKITCGHFCCSSCLKKVEKNKQPSVCVVNNCGQIIEKRHFDLDLNMEYALLQFTGINCHNQSRGCLWRGDYHSYKGHLQVCIFEHFQCEYCSICFTDRLLYNQHHATCPKAFIVCPYKKFGCNDEFHQEAGNDHIIKSYMKHSQLITNMYSSVQNQSITISPELLPIPSLTILTIDNSHIEWLQNEVVKRDKRLERIRLKQASLQSRIIKFEKDSENTRTILDGELSDDQLNELLKEYTLSILFNRDNHTYKWNVYNIRELVENAKQASEPIHVNSVFDTYQYNYQIGLKLFLNGDKKTQNTHLALHVTVMPGDNDSLLKCPFSYPITVCLCDPSSKNEHLIRVICPNTNTECCQQPKLNENKNFEISAFCELKKVFDEEFGYIEGDILTIMVFVDFDKEKTFLLPGYTT